MTAKGKFGNSSVRIPDALPAAGSGQVLPDSLTQGEARVVKWTQDGTLLPVSAVEAAWGIKRQPVGAVRARSEIFSVYVRGQHLYATEALKFERASLTKCWRSWVIRARRASSCSF
jgi:hypothetical protein